MLLSEILNIPAKVRIVFRTEVDELMSVFLVSKMR